MGTFLQRIKPLFIVLGALGAALVVTLGVLQVRSLLASRPNAEPPAGSFTEQQKLDILASLSASSSPTVAQKSKVLRSLSTPAEDTPTEEEKLKILQSLQTKP